MAISKLMIGAFAGAGIVAVSVGAVSVMATVSDSSGSSGVSDLREKYTVASHIQLKPFMAPSQGAGQRTVPITVFLESVDKKWTGTICRQNPRIRDTILMVLYQSPIRIRGGEMNLKGLPEIMVPYINQALGYPYIKSVHIVAGAKTMSKGAVSRLPFNASGCKGIKDLKKATN